MQNADGGKFCRFCGVALMQSSSGDPSRKPYSWQSEEINLNDRTQGYQAKKTQVFNQPQPQQQQQQQRQPPPQYYQQPGPQMVQPLQMQQMQQMPAPLYGQLPQYAYGHRYCPNCHTQIVPRYKRKISQAGWIVFVVLLVSIPPLFWIGLCIREDAQMCPICNTRVG
jgi:hypothetical protein